MQFYYIKFESPKYLEESEEKGKKYNKIKLFLLKAFVRILKIVIPMTNPDYEERIDDVKFWLLEFEEENSYPVREIGLDENQRSIVKMPYKKTMVIGQIII